MTTIELISLIAGITSIILSLLAIWLALYFYKNSKTSEEKTATTLESIKTQGQMLERLTGRWMDRLTKHAISPKPVDESTIFLAGFVKEIMPGLNSNLQLPELEKTNQELVNEVVNTYIGLYYYIAICNVAAQGHLPEKIEDLDENQGAKIIVDQSYADFKALESLVDKIETQKITASPLNHLYGQTKENWGTLVKDTTGVYQSRATSSSDV